MSVPDGFTSLGEARFVSLTTFRRNGDGVATPVWIARFGEHLVVTTPAASGKVKRLRRDGRVLLVPCGRFGGVEPGAVPVEGLAEVLGPDREHPGETEVLRRKYGLEYRGITALEASARRRRGETDERLIVRITPAA
ncbi:PPOX class F420-dependent oxidoreductase [Kineococcus gypseus]|uniref:PPOX class F420-dependent oxidoreductase n=1 Tax=Kineococcus gypseus TaxID=1637102 RepID=UPI003D7E4FA3